MRTGTSSLVVAAFIGPGTVLTCASAGVDFGYDLGWVLVFATGTAFVLQSLTAGTGILAGRGLGEAIRVELGDSRLRWGVTALVVLGLWVGCAAFELGNLMGAAAGVQALLANGTSGGGVEVDARWVAAALAAGAGLVLLLDLRVIVRVFSMLVVAMSALFLASLALAPVDWAAALRGLVVPAIPPGSAVRVVALVGTTVVTYNLFLHPSTARRHWADAPDRRAAWRSELRGMALFLPIGGLTSFAILAAGATLHETGGVSKAGDVAAFADMLEPVAGDAARWCFGLGLLAAGLTSAITAPLAAAAGVCELFGWEQGAERRHYRLVWGSVLGTGLVLALTGLSPLPAIIAAQAANGVLLPFVGAFVLWLTVRQDVVQIPVWYRILGGVVTLVCAGLGVQTLYWVWLQLA